MSDKKALQPPPKQTQVLDDFADAIVLLRRWAEENYSVANDLLDNADREEEESNGTRARGMREKSEAIVRLTAKVMAAIRDEERH